MAKDTSEPRGRPPGRRTPPSKNVAKPRSLSVRSEISRVRDRAPGPTPGWALATLKPRDVEWIMRRLAGAITGLEWPIVEKIADEQREDAFQVLIATLLSARTQDATTAAASARLFASAPTLRRMAALSVRQIERLIYPVSFYRNKAEHVKATCRILLDTHNGRVPGTMEQLLTLPGVGRKTANLVLILGFKSVRNICVDTHVHRISNRIGWVQTSTPEQTEHALYARLDARWWSYLNLYLVTWGQHVCRPIFPRCGDCVIRERCPRIGVTVEGKPRSRSRPR
jgi:endonuclease III